MALETNALTTLAVVKTELAISGTDNDSKIERAINAVSEAIANYCNRKLHHDAAIVESHSGDGTRLLVLDRPPIVSITSITIEGETALAATYEIINADGGILGRKSEQAASTWPKTSREAITVTYSGGFVTPAQVGTRSLPFDLEDVAIAMAARYYRGRFDSPRDDPNIAELWLGGNTRVRWAEAKNLATLEEQAILNKYRRL